MASIIDRVSSPIRGRRDPQPEPVIVEPPPTEEDFAEMTLQEHLEELRQRILRASLAILGGIVVGVFFAFDAIEAIAGQAGVDTDQLQIISPTEPFTVYFKVVLYIAIAVAMPVLIYQLLSFVSPGLTRRERRYVLISVPFVMASFVAGVAFAFFILVPRALGFLSTFGSEHFLWNPRAEDVLSFYMRMMLGVGLLFELPVVMYALTVIGVGSPQRYGKFRKFALILGMVAAAIITPTPDPFNMMLVAVPTYGLYEVGVLLSRTVRRSTRE